MKIITVILFVFVNIFSLIAQEKPSQVSGDALKFEDILVYNKIINREFTLHTKFTNIANFIDNSKTGLRLAPGSSIPLCTFSDNEIFYTLYAEYFIFCYKAYTIDDDLDNFDGVREDIFIKFIKPCEEIDLIIIYNKKRIVLNSEIKPSDLNQYFGRSYKSYFENKDLHSYFTLQVIKDDRIAYLYLEFENDRFVGIRLSKEKFR